MFDFDLLSIKEGPPNGSRYPLVGGMRQRHFTGTNFKPHKVLENAETPTSRVHAVLGASSFFWNDDLSLFIEYKRLDCRNVIVKYFLDCIVIVPNCIEPFSTAH